MSASSVDVSVTDARARTAIPAETLGSWSTKTGARPTSPAAERTDAPWPTSDQLPRRLTSKRRSARTRKGRSDENKSNLGLHDRAHGDVSRLDRLGQKHRLGQHRLKVSGRR